MDGYEKFDNVEGLETPSTEQVQLPTIVSGELEVGAKVISLIAKVKRDFQAQKHKFTRYVRTLWLLCISQMIASSLITLFGLICIVNSVFNNAYP